MPDPLPDTPNVPPDLPIVPAYDVPDDVRALLARADRDVEVAQDCERLARHRGILRGSMLMRAGVALRERAEHWRAVARSYERAVQLGAEARAALVVEDERQAAHLDRMVARELRR